MRCHTVLLFVFVVMIGITGASETTSARNRHLGVTLPTGTKPLAAHRFQSSRSYEDTKKEFRERFSKSETIKLLGDEINLPHVRAVLYQNFAKNALFFGINIYLNVQTGLTEIFFLVNESQEEKH